MSIKIYPYKQGSRSAKALADYTGGRVLKLQGSAYRQRPNDLIVNWGCSGDVPYEDILNTTPAVATASNKLAAFNMLKADNTINIPNFWVNKDEINDQDFPVVCRTVLNGHSGRGIVLANSRDDLVDAPLYVQYVKKKQEYRVHVVKESIIAVQRKARNAAVANPNWQIRNHDNGFVFVRNFDDPPADLHEQAIKAISALGLDFGAVDIIYNQHSNRSYVLEVNTAPGLEGQTIADYGEAFKRIANG